VAAVGYSWEVIGCLVSTIAALLKNWSGRPVLRRYCREGSYALSSAAPTAS
jgi:hypothetical protein